MMNSRSAFVGYQSRETHEGRSTGIPFMKITGLAHAQGIRVPDWYGFAYSNMNSDCSVYYPLPFNFLVYWARELYWTLRRPRGGAMAANELLKAELNLRNHVIRELQDELRIATEILAKRGNPK